MSYDRRRLRGYHPAACTCVDCKEGRRQRPPESTPTVWPPRPLSPSPAPSHPTHCPCSECRERRARIRQEQDQQVREAQQALRAQQALITPPPPAKPRVNRKNVAPPYQFHSYVCTCKPCGDAREQQHREASPTPRLGTAAARVPPPRVGIPLRTLLKIAMPLVFVVLLVASVVWWTTSSSASASSEPGGTTQVTENNGSWFSGDCDNERRRRRRGGWLRALIC